MDVREKLVELLDDIQARGETFTDYEIYGMRLPDTISNEDVASHLIANSVTVQDSAEISNEFLEQLRNTPVTILQEEPTIELVQEWISVKDRLPERYKYVILWDAMDRDIFMGVLDDKREWYVPGYQDEPFHITHWMPLPQPPKGE